MPPPSFGAKIPLEMVETNAREPASFAAREQSRGLLVAYA
jgi:hypothetical protein